MKNLLMVCINIGFAITFISLAGAQTSESDIYRVGANDVIEIKVLDHPDLRTTTAITSDGTITFPYLGTVYVKDMNLAEIEKEITKKLSEGYVKYPVVAVSLVQSLSKRIYTYGEFLSRGDIPYVDGMTVMKALSTIGGFSRETLFGKIIIRRKLSGTKKYKNIAQSEINNGFIINRNIEDITLQPDDILIVERNKTFLIEGEVSQRGRVVLERDITVLRALLQAGGVSENGRYGTIKVRRKQEGGEYTDVAEAKLNDGVIEDRAVEEMLLQPDDVLIVERNETFLIEGEVSQRGRVVLERDMTVLRALLQAGGVSENGRYGTIKVRRKQEGGEYTDAAEAKLNDGVIEDRAVEEMLLQPDDILIVERNETFLIEGEVSQRGRVVLDRDMTVLRALLQAGGVSENGRYGTIKVRRKQEGGEYTDAAEAKLNDGVIEDRTIEEMLLQPDDILIVERNKTYFVYGEFVKKGEFVLKNNITVFQAITIAGGFTKWGSASRVKVLRLSNDKGGFETIGVDINDVIDGDSTADVNLQPGDIIIASAGIL